MRFIVKRPVYEPEYITGPSGREVISLLKGDSKQKTNLRNHRINLLKDMDFSSQVDI